ncbi:MAG TPA: ABC transporter permease [Verrucomicrobiae bacterium]|nr:ABC transporter permease [Verrucomicrobiae bacterium]
MAIPLAYNLRNLVVRKTTTLMTALGIALTVAVLLSILALVNGLKGALTASGDPLRIVVVRKGSTSELVSNFVRAAFQDLKFKPGMATGSDGQPLASLEMITIVNLARENDSDVNVNVRAMLPVGRELRPNVRIVQGRWFNPGQREMVVGRMLAVQHDSAQVGKKIHFGRGDWDIVGVMDGGGGATDSEIWADLNQISSDMQRVEILSSATLKATDAVAAQALINDINNDQRLDMSAQNEQAYYVAQTDSATPIRDVGIFVAIVMAVGSSFAAMNTMYAAVSRRAREIGTLRVLGFSRGSILISFFVESMLLSILGGVLGCLLALPLNGMSTQLGANFATLAFGFKVTPDAMIGGVVFAVVMGAIGGLFPARMASKKEILTALREV